MGVCGTRGGHRFECVTCVPPLHRTVLASHAATSHHVAVLSGGADSIYYQRSIGRNCYSQAGSMVDREQYTRGTCRDACTSDPTCVAFDVSDSYSGPEGSQLKSDANEYEDDKRPRDAGGSLLRGASLKSDVGDEEEEDELRQRGIEPAKKVGCALIQAESYEYTCKAIVDRDVADGASFDNSWDHFKKEGALSPSCFPPALLPRVAAKGSRL